MKQSIGILISLLFHTLSVFSQYETVSLNTKQNLFAVNQTDRVICSINPLVRSFESITIRVDTTNTTSFEFHSLIFPHELVIDSSTSGRIDTTVLIGSRIIHAFPVYLTYYGNDEIRISIQDYHFVAVQQALDSSGNWVSFEHFLHSEDGNSYSGLKLTKNQSSLFKIAKYTGSYPTKLRLKVLFDDQVYYSNEFKGSINYEQFNSIYDKKESELIFR